MKEVTMDTVWTCIAFDNFVIGVYIYIYIYAASFNSHALIHLSTLILIALYISFGSLPP